MTSTNDGKDVKSNQTSGHKGKTYYIELYKSLEARLSSECSLSALTGHVCDAWRRVYSLYQHSAPPTHPHLLAWLQRHTARLVLQTEWQSPNSKDEHAKLEAAIDALIAEAQAAATQRDAPLQWEQNLLQRAQWFRKALADPWGHPVLKRLLNPTGEPVTDEQILEWLIDEWGVVFICRLRQLAASRKCEDLALTLATAVMDRARAARVLVADDDLAEEKAEPEEDSASFCAVLKRDAGFAVDIWEILTDIEFVLLHKQNKRARCIELAKQTPLRNGYHLVERLRSRLETSPRDKKLWKNAKEVATLVAQVVIARCMVLTTCSGAGRSALYCCARSLARLVPPSRLPAVTAALAAPAATARHLHTLCAAIYAHYEQCAGEMKPFVCELYVRAITAGMNELERLKLNADKQAEARSSEQTLASWFTQLGTLLSDSARLRAECALTAFSVHPAPKMYERVRQTPAPPPLPLHTDPQPQNPESASEFGSWANDSRSQSNLVKTSETLQLKHTQHQANVLSTAILTEGETLGLSTELGQDLAVLLSGPRVKTLSWDTDRELLLENCRAYMERTHGGTRALTTELKYLNLDPRAFQHLPEEEDEEENDAYYGIEKGYEHLVQLEEPEEIWQNAFFDPEQTESANESELENYQLEPKKKGKHASSDEDSDPLSLFADAKREKKKKADKEKRKERRKKTHKRDSSKDANKERRKEKEKKPKKERKKKFEQAEPSSLTSLLGMKVTTITSQVQDGEKRVRKKKERRREETAGRVSVTDSDYDSQGKLSQVSDNNDTQVVVDGLFSMNELKTQDRRKSDDSKKPTDNTNLSLTDNVVYFPSTLIKPKDDTKPKAKPKVPSTNESSANRAKSPYPTPNQLKNRHVLCSKVKNSITKLLQFRKKRAAMVTPKCLPTTGLKIETGGPALPTHSLVGMKVMNKEELLNRKQNEPSEAIKNEYNNLLNMANEIKTYPNVTKVPYKEPVKELDTKASPQNVYNVQNNQDARYYQQYSSMQNIVQNPNVLSETQKAYSEYNLSSQKTYSNVVNPPPRPTSVINSTYVSPPKQYEKRYEHTVISPAPSSNLSRQTFHKSMQNLNQTSNVKFEPKNQGIGDPKYNERNATNNEVSPSIQSNTSWKSASQTTSQLNDSTSFTKANEDFMKYYQISPKTELSRVIQSTQGKEDDLYKRSPDTRVELKTYGQKQFNASLQNILNETLGAVSNDIAKTLPTSNDSLLGHTSHIKTYSMSETNVQRNLNTTDNKPHSQKVTQATRPKKPSNIVKDTTKQQPSKVGKSNNIEEFLEKLHKSLNAGVTNTGKPRSIDFNDQVKLTYNPISTSTPVGNESTPQSAKLIQQRKAENAPNTFSRLSYMHKNKQSENKLKNDPHCVELNKTILDHKLSKAKYMKNEVVISRVDKRNLPKDSANVQAPCRKSDQPNAKLQKQCPVLSSMLDSKPQEPNRSYQTSTSTNASHSSSESMTNREHADLLLLLRNQHILKVPQVKTRPTDVGPSNQVVDTQIRIETPVPIKHQRTLDKDYLTTSVTNFNINNLDPGTVQNLQQKVEGTKESDEKGQDWESVMNALLAHKTQPISVNALDMVMKKGKRHSHGNSRSSSQKPKLPSSSSQNKSDPKKREGSNSRASSHKPSIEKHLETPKIPNQTTVIKKTSAVQIPKKTEAPNKHFTSNPPKQDDPFISGIHNSDYDLLEELMDDDLRKEIGELSSDDESYQTSATTKAKGSYNVSKTNVCTKQEPKLKHSVDPKTTVLCKNANIQTQRDDSSCSRTTPVSCSRAGNVNVITHPDLSDAKKISEHRQTVLYPNMESQQTNPTIATNLREPNHFIANITPRNVMEPLFITSIPAQPVVVISQELIYDPYPTIRIQESQVTAGLCNVTPNAYVSLNTAPNIALYQTTQFAAPVINPVIIGNAMTTTNVTVTKDQHVYTNCNKEEVKSTVKDTDNVVKEELKAAAINPEVMEKVKPVKNTDIHKEEVISTVRNEPVPISETQSKEKPIVIEERSTILDFNMNRNSERKVLSQMQENHTKESVDRDPLMKRLTVDKQKTDKDEARIKMKRESLINRKINHPSLHHPPIPLTYSPLVKKNKLLQGTPVNSTVKSNFELKSNSTVVDKDAPASDSLLSSKSENNNENIESTDQSLSTKENQQVCRRILLRSSNKLESKATTAKHGRIPLRRNRFKPMPPEKLEKLTNAEEVQEKKDNIEATTKTPTRISRRIQNKNKKTVQVPDTATSLEGNQKPDNAIENSTEKVIPDMSLIDFENELSGSKIVKTSLTSSTSGEVHQDLKKEMDVTDVDKVTSQNKNAQLKEPVLKDAKVSSETTVTNESTTGSAVCIEKLKTDLGDQFIIKSSSDKEVTKNPILTNSKNENQDKKSNEALNNNASSSNNKIVDKISNKKTSDSKTKIVISKSVFIPIRKMISSKPSIVSNNAQKLDANHCSGTSPAVQQKDGKDCEIDNTHMKNTKLPQTLPTKGGAVINDKSSILPVVKNNEVPPITEGNKVNERTILVPSKTPSLEQMTTQNCPKQIIPNNVVKETGIQVLPTNSDATAHGSLSKENSLLENTGANKFNETTKDNDCAQKANGNEPITDPKSKAPVAEKHNNPPEKLITETQGQAFNKKDVIIEDIPIPGNLDPSKKCVRVKLPNGKIFKATIRGKMRIDYDTLFAEPAFRAVLAGGLSDGKRYTLNIKQISQTSKTNPTKIDTKYPEINIEEKEPIDTVNLISDDEDDDTQSFNTEFGKYTTKVDLQTFIKHQKKFSQKCVVKVCKQDAFKSNRTKPKTKSSRSVSNSLLTRNQSKMITESNAVVPQVTEHVPSVDLNSSKQPQKSTTVTFSKNVPAPTVQTENNATIVNEVEILPPVDLNSCKQQQKPSVPMLSKNVSAPTVQIENNAAIVHQVGKCLPSVDLNSCIQQQKASVPMLSTNVSAPTVLIEKNVAIVHQVDKCLSPIDLNSCKQQQEVPISIVSRNIVTPTVVMSEVIEIDDSSNDSTDIRMPIAESSANLEPVQKIIELKDLLLQDLGVNDKSKDEVNKCNEALVDKIAVVENLKTALLEDLGVANITESVDSPPTAVNKRPSTDEINDVVTIVKNCVVRIARCENLIKKYELMKKAKECFVLLQRCDTSFLIRQDLVTSNDIMDKDQIKEFDVEIDDDFIDFHDGNASDSSPLSRCPSLSILNFWDDASEITTGNLSGRNSPVMEVFEMLVSLRNKPKDNSKLLDKEQRPFTCDSEWMTTKHALSEDTRVLQEDVFHSLKPRRQEHKNSLKSKHDAGDYKEYSAKTFETPTLVAIALKFLENNSEILYRHQSLCHAEQGHIKPSRHSNNLKRKTMQATLTDVAYKIPRLGTLAINVINSYCDLPTFKTEAVPLRPPSYVTQRPITGSNFENTEQSEKHEEKFACSVDFEVFASLKRLDKTTDTNTEKVVFAPNYVDPRIRKENIPSSDIGDPQIISQDNNPDETNTVVTQDSERVFVAEEGKIKKINITSGVKESPEISDCQTIAEGIELDESVVEAKYSETISSLQYEIGNKATIESDGNILSDKISSVTDVTDYVTEEPSRPLKNEKIEIDYAMPERILNERCLKDNNTYHSLIGPGELETLEGNVIKDDNCPTSVTSSVNYGINEELNTYEDEGVNNICKDTTENNTNDCLTGHYNDSKSTLDMSVIRTEDTDTSVPNDGIEDVDRIKKPDNQDIDKIPNEEIDKDENVKNVFTDFNTTRNNTNDCLTEPDNSTSTLDMCVTRTEDLHTSVLDHDIENVNRIAKSENQDTNKIPNEELNAHEDENVKNVRTDVNSTENNTQNCLTEQYGDSSSTLETCDTCTKDLETSVLYHDIDNVNRIEIPENQDKNKIPSEELDARKDGNVKNICTDVISTENNTNDCLTEQFNESTSTLGVCDTHTIDLDTSVPYYDMENVDSIEKPENQDTDTISCKELDKREDENVKNYCADVNTTENDKHDCLTEQYNDLTSTVTACDTCAEDVDTSPILQDNELDLGSKACDSKDISNYKPEYKTTIDSANKIGQVESISPVLENLNAIAELNVSNSEMESGNTRILEMSPNDIPSEAYEVEIFERSIEDQTNVIPISSESVITNETFSGIDSNDSQITSPPFVDNKEIIFNYHDYTKPTKVKKSMTATKDNPLNTADSNIEDKNENVVSKEETEEILTPRKSLLNKQPVSVDDLPVKAKSGCKYELIQEDDWLTVITTENDTACPATETVVSSNTPKNVFENVDVKPENLLSVDNTNDTTCSATELEASSKTPENVFENVDVKPENLLGVDNTNDTTCSATEPEASSKTPENVFENVDVKPENLLDVVSTGVTLKGIEYEDPVIGTCYVFTLNESGSSASNVSNESLEVSQNNWELNRLNNALYEQLHDVELCVIAPKLTYSKRNLKRKINTWYKTTEKKPKMNIRQSDSRIVERKYRKSKNIDCPRQTVTSIIESAYSKEYKRLLEYCSSVKFSYFRPFHKEYVDISDMVCNWPINKTYSDIPEDIVDKNLFLDVEDIPIYQPDPATQTLAEEISYEYERTDDLQENPSCEVRDTNFNMGFGEGSGRVIQNLKKKVDDSNISAATLSDVKQSQPLITSEDYDEVLKKNKDDQIKKIRQYVNFLELRDKVRSFFKKTSVELKYDWMQYKAKDDIKLKSNEKLVTDLCGLEYVNPFPTEAVIQVVQVGQLPVSAAAQNPVTCDPRVTQVSDASPSQCSVDNSPNDDSQSEIKTEYTELTTADLTLPLVQEYAHQNQAVNLESHDADNMELTEQTISLEMEIKAEERIEIKEEMPEVKEEVNNSVDNPDLHPVSNATSDHVEYSFENNTSKSDTSNVIYDSSEQNNSEIFSHQRQQNGTTEKTDQIAHAMNAAGITTTPESLTNSRAHALVNILSQKIRQGSVNTTQTTTNTYSKTTSINAMALQQALAQILPPPLNQTGNSENNQSSSTPVGPQVLHIVQGKNASGNQITLLDNSQQSVISGPNATQVLHIVQNKGPAVSQASNGTLTPQPNSFSGLSLVDAGLQQGGNQLLHIVNTGNQKNSNPGQLLKRVNLLTNLANVQGSNEQKMVQFVCKSADGKAIQLNAPHQRSMVLRLQPIEPTQSVQTPPAKPTESQDLSPSPTNSTSSKENASQQEIKSRSIYEENYAKFIQNSSSKTPNTEKSTSLPKFNQAFGKPVFQEGNQKQAEVANTNSHMTAVNTNTENSECPVTDNGMNLEHMTQIGSPPLLLRKPVVTSQSQSNLVQQIKQTIAPMNIQTMHGGVIYTRQIPVNIGGGQTINLITVPSTELINDEAPKSQTTNQGEMEPSIIKIVPQTQNNSSSESSQEDNNSHPNSSNENAQNSQPQPVLTQMRIKLPMLSKAPQMVPGARVVRPSFFQIQRNVIGGANQPVYQQLVLTAAPPLGQQTIRLPQAQASRPVKVQSESQSSDTSQMSSSTLEQLREFDMVLEQVKERSTVQPTTSTNNSPFKIHNASSDTTDGTGSSNCSNESTQQVLYSIGNTQSLSVAYVNRKATVTTPTTSTYVRSPDSSSIGDSPTSSTHVQISHTVTTDSSPTEMTSQPKPAKIGGKSKSRPKSSSNPPNTLKLNSVPPKTSSQKPLEDEQTTQRILYILAEYKEQVENSPDKDKPAPRRRSNPPSNPGSSKRKKSSSSRRSGTRDMSPVHGEDTCRTMGSEDSSCGTSQGDCTESCLDSHSPQDSPRKVARKITFDQDLSSTQPRPQPQRNVIVADGQTITVARGTTGKPTTAVLMPANYILPVSMVKGGQQIAIVTNRGPKLLTVGGEAGAANALLLQRLIGPGGLKPVLARPGVRHVRLPTAALHNLQAFNLATTTSVQPPDSTASPTPGPTPPELVDTRATSSPWTDREDVKPERGSSPEGSEPWNLPSSADAHEYTYEETVRTENMDRTVLDPIPDRYSPDMEAQRIFDKMFDVDSKKSYAVDSHDDSPRCAYDIDASDCDDKAYQVVQKKDGTQRQHRLSHVSAAALRHKYAILEHELRLQKSLSEECEDLGVDSPSASELFPEAELLFAASPAHEHHQDQHRPHTPQPHQSSIPQPDMDDQIATDHLIPREIDSLGLGDVGIVAVSEDGMQTTIALDQEEFARSHPNTTFHSEPTEGEVRATSVKVQPFTITGLKGRHITSTIFHSNSAPATVLMAAPQPTVISQAPDHGVKYEIENMINSMPSSHNNDVNLSSVLVKDEGLTRFDNILTDSRELHLTNTASAIVHSSGNTTQVIRRVCYEDDKRERDSRYLIDEPENLIAGDDAKMIAEDSSRDATLESMADVDDDRSSPERHAELFWESNSASERSESRRPLDFSSDSDKCCKSPSFDETNSTDSSGVGTHMRLDSVIKEARGRERSGSAGSSADDTPPPLRTYPPKRLYHPLEGEVERSLSGKTRAGERSPDSLEVRRRASGRGVVKRGCHCCNGSPAPARPKKPRQRKPTLDFNTNN